MSADFWAGYISGAAGIIVGNPLDLIKTRTQAGGSYAGTNVRSTFESAGTLVRGASAPVLGYGALNALLFVTYNRSLALLSGNSANPSYAQIYLAGICGGLATFVVSAPTELIKVRAQIANSNAAAATGVGVQTSSLAITKEIWRREGLRGLYLGGGITAWRDAVGYGFYFCSYDMSKRLLASPGETIDNLSAWKILLAGGIAGCISWASIFPMDVIKTRMQSQPIPGSKSVVHSAISSRASSPQPASVDPIPVRSAATATSYGSVSQSVTSSSAKNPAHSSRLSTFAMVKQTYGSEGLSVFFRGLGICSVRAFIVNAVQWAVYEWVMTVLVPKQGHKTDMNETLKLGQ